jgi:CheY-like chemotaxis protein
MNGIEFAEVIREQHPLIPVLLTTGYFHMHQNRLATKHTILPKPYDESDLLKALDKVLLHHNTG